MIFKRFHIAPFAFGLYPILALLAYNVQEVSLQSALRPILVSMAATTLLLILGRLIFKNWDKSGLLVTFLLILFFSYGHVYSLLERVSVGGFSPGRHRYLILLYGAILAIGLWWILIRRNNLTTYRSVIYFLNIAGVVLLILPCLKVTYYLIQASVHQKAATQLMVASDQQLQAQIQPLPDVYYIILDAHTRSDALKEDYGFDNSPYLDKLRSMGFYITDCSRSNYGYTQASIVATLNLNYLPELDQDLKDLNLGDDIWVLLKQSRVRRQLEALGYKTVAFDTGYEWSRLTDADVYLSLGADTYGMQAISPFESMLIKSTAMLILTDSQNKFLRSNFSEVNSPYSFHINSQRFILDQLVRIPQDPEPKFVFVHLLIPHYPLIFDAQGQVVTDPGFYSGEKGGPINKEYLQKGYVNQVQFIDQKIVDIIQILLAQSKTPPIIVLQGDHGLQGDNRFKILNAYYLPGESNNSLYPAITPVNSFRVIFDTYFGTHYGLVTDLSYSNEGELLTETSPACLH
jgi:hypothetical protein